MKTEFVREKEALVRAHYDAVAPAYGQWLDRRGYYYARKAALLRHIVPRPGRTLEIGCGLGQNLAAMNVTEGVGIDLCEAFIREARERFPEETHPHLTFRTLSALDCDQLEGTFDTIVLANSASEIPDLVALHRTLRTLCTPSTRIVHLTYNYLLRPLIKMSGALGWAPRHPTENWLTRFDLENITRLGGFETIREGYDAFMPLGPAWLANPVNRVASLLPGVRLLSMLYYLVLRPVPEAPPEKKPSVTVCVPCKNEEENIDGLVARIPAMGSATEIIFVDDQSTDATAGKVNAHLGAQPDGRVVRLVTGPGAGKGAACRAGFADAKNDILMILDADMTVMPEALPDFYEALVSGRGEFVNGSRLVYPMEDEAMRFANIVGNRVFAMIFSFVLSQPVKDTLCGTKVIWRRDYPKICEAREHFGGVDVWGDYDWIFGAARHNLKLVELPVYYRERRAGVTKMTRRLRNGVIMLRMCWVALRKVRLV